MSLPSDRRSFLRGLVSLPLIGGGVTLAGPAHAATPSALAPDHALFLDQQKQLVEANKKWRLALDAHEQADERKFRWQRRNPKPVMRKYRVPKGPERDAYIRCVLDGLPIPPATEAVMADCDAAYREYDDQLQAWEIRRHRYLRRIHYKRIEEDANMAGDVVCALEHRAASTRATTWESLKCKARILRRASANDVEFTAPLIEDVLAMSD